MNDTKIGRKFGVLRSGSGADRASTFFRLRDRRRMGVPRCFVRGFRVWYDEPYLVLKIQITNFSGHSLLHGVDLEPVHRWAGSILGHHESRGVHE